MSEQPRRITRRRLVVAGAVLAAGAGGTALVVDGLGDGQGGPPPAPPPPSPPTASAAPPSAGEDLADVLREATATAGVRLDGSPWQAWGAASGAPAAAAWDGLWVAWLLRAHGADPAATTAEDLLALVRAQGGTTTEPRPGALAFYRRGADAGALRVALVVSVTGSVQTLEGDHPVLLQSSERFVRRFARPGPGLAAYGLPGYAT